ncbi:hypothetical protein RND81_14G247200 [Saponaria officinalis]|uniref:Uncharacterized protein n=1 Tax=Saponaria officinalis TaxID=3572 RepID=A0AAW1GR30_SAPOF
MDDEIAKAMKVIRLKGDWYGQYLTAADDQVSVTLTKPKTKSYNPKNTEWRLEWLNNSPKGLVGQVRLWSIYDKALTFDKDPGDYMFSNCSGYLRQRSWSPSDGGSEAASEWQFVLKRKNKDVVAAYLHKWSKSYREYFNLSPGNSSRDDKPKFNFDSLFTNRFFQWANSAWLVQVVATDDDSDDHSSDDSDDHNNGHESSDHSNHDNTVINQDTTLSTIVNQKASVPSDQPRSLMQSPVCNNKFTPMNNNQEINHHHGARYARNNDIGQLHDHYMNMLSRWQVGQVFFQVAPISTGFHAGDAYKYGHYANSGGNVNGSGVQKNGDVSLYSETNRSRDNNANFVNYEYK